MNRFALSVLACAALLELAGCKGSSDSSGFSPQHSASQSRREALEPARGEGKAATGAPNAAFRFPAAERVVAIGDLHGDLSATRRALRLAGAIDDDDRWSGGKLVVVQTGDQLDRGDDEKAIIDLLDSLKPQAEKAGGALHILNGNHETMNVAGDFRYVTRGGFSDFASIESGGVPDAVLSRFPEPARGRVAAFFPGGVYAKRLAERRIIVVVGDTVFAHGGVTPEHVRYGIDRLNAETSRWMLGESAAPPSLVMDADGPVWTRRYSEIDRPADCETLAQTLSALRVKRMVVGHTPQKSGITAACEERIWRIDVGMAAHYGGPVEVLELTGRGPRPLRFEKKETN